MHLNSCVSNCLSTLHGYPQLPSPLSSGLELLELLPDLAMCLPVHEQCWLSIRTHESARKWSCCTSGSTRRFWGSNFLDKPKSEPLRCSETPSGSTNQRLKQKKLLGHVCTNAIIQSKSSLDVKSLGWSSPWLDSSARIETPWRTLRIAWRQRPKLQSRAQQVS